MLEDITPTVLASIQNAEFKQYAQQYLAIEAQTIQAIEQLGLAFNDNREVEQQSQALLARLKQAGAQFANGGKSIFTHWRSSACAACEKGIGSHTSFLSLKCHRDCYFCFNPNQQDYDYYCQHQRDAIGELATLTPEQMGAMTHMALTGGEPLLLKNESIQFFEYIQQKMPHVHTRLYTASDAFSQQTAIRLKDSGLDEIRFSIKVDDTSQEIEKQLAKIKIARSYIPCVMVEMPVLPHSEEVMYQLLVQLDEIGIDGINLLEFCFPFRNAPLYQEKGFALKYPPYETYYNYWYAGGLAVAKSELLCLQLLEFALQKQLKMGVHYCSLENKFTGQIYQQNVGYAGDESYVFSQRDYFLKTAKVFGEDIDAVNRTLKQYEVPSVYNSDYNCLQFNPQHIKRLKDLDVEVCISFNVVEGIDPNERLVKEVKLMKTSPKSFALSDI